MCFSLFFFSKTGLNLNLNPDLPEGQICPTTHTDSHTVSDQEEEAMNSAAEEVCSASDACHSSAADKHGQTDAERRPTTQRERADKTRSGRDRGRGRETEGGKEGERATGVSAAQVHGISSRLSPGP